MIFIFLLLLAFQLYGIMHALESPPEGKKEPDHPCPSCGRNVESGWLACPFCRHTLSASCSACGEIVAVYYRHCPSCGAFKEKTP